VAGRGKLDARPGEHDHQRGPHPAQPKGGRRGCRGPGRGHPSATRRARGGGSRPWRTRPGGPPVFAREGWVRFFFYIFWGALRGGRTLTVGWLRPVTGRSINPRAADFFAEISDGPPRGGPFAPHRPPVVWWAERSRPRPTTRSPTRRSRRLGRDVDHRRQTLEPSAAAPASGRRPGRPDETAA
jgi:hypothetical protein